MFKRLDSAAIKTAAMRVGTAIQGALRSRTPVVIAHPDCRYDASGDRLSLILSPAYYWYRRSDIPLKSARAARKIAPSLFFGWLPEGGSYRYFAHQERDGHYGVFALDLDAVAKELAEQGLAPERIDRLYFAQAALDPQAPPLRVSETSALGFVDGICVSLPLAYLPQAPDEPGALSAQGPSARLGRVHSAGVSRGHFAVAASLLLLVATAQAISWYQAASQISAFEQKRADLLSEARLPATNIQLAAIERQLQGIHTEQMALRDHLTTLLATPLEGAHIQSLSIESGELRASFEGLDGSQEAALGSRLSERLEGAQVRARDGVLEVRLQW